MYEAVEVDGSAVMAGGEAAEMPEASEASLDPVAMLAGAGITRDGDLAAAFRGDHRFGALPFEQGRCGDDIAGLSPG